MDKRKLVSTALGGITQNPVFVLVLGICPVLGTSTLSSALILGLATAAVLVFSNLLISLLRKLIPDKVRIPCYIVIIASLVTLVDLFLGHFLAPESYDSVSTYIALITVNCIVLGRAEAFAAKNNPLYSTIDGLSMGLGFVVALSIYGALRELLAFGTLYGASVLGSGYVGISMFASTPGAFILLGLLMAAFNVIYTLAKKSLDKRSRMNLSLAGKLVANSEANVQEPTRESAGEPAVKEG